MPPDIPFVDTGSYPVRAGILIRPLVDGEPAFRRICEAIEAARHSIWAAITFMWPSFETSDGRGHPLDVFERAALRGIDVRRVFYRPQGAVEDLKTNAFWGSPAAPRPKRAGTR